MPLPIIGSLLLSVGVKLGVDFVKKIWQERQSAGTSSTTSESFGAVLKDRTAAVPTATDLPVAAATPRVPGATDGLVEARRLGLEDTAAALLHGANRNTGGVGGSGTPAADAVASYLRNVPQAG